MGCTDCDDNKIPMSLATGSDGKSVTIAFASDESGTDFSYTPSDTLPYISFVNKTGSVSQSDFTTWVKYHGDDGTNGTDGTAGTSITNAYFSDGSTAIGGTVYDIDTLVLELSNGNYVSVVLQPQWKNLVLLNLWGPVDDDAKSGIPQYAFFMGKLHFRGWVAATSATAVTVATTASVSGADGLPGSHPTNGDVYSNIVQNTSGTLSTAYMKFTHSGGIYTLTIDTYATSDHFDLGSITPISVVS
jgi:hypothetical protein